MARVNVYLPDDLAAEAKRAGLPISELTQSVVRDALARRERMDALESWIEQLTAGQGPATAEEVAEAAAWAEAVVQAAADAAKPRRRRAASR